jgi:hypothetical protein
LIVHKQRHYGKKRATETNIGTSFEFWNTGLRLDGGREEEKGREALANLHTSEYFGA